MIEEINMFDINDDNSQILLNLEDDELKLKRSKPLPDSFNTLETCIIFHSYGSILPINFWFGRMLSRVLP